MKNWRDTLLSQYATSPTISSMIETFNEVIDPHADIDGFFNTIWNVESAGTYGLNVWGKIVNVSRTISVLIPATYFGFAEAYTAATPTTGVQPFDCGTFNDGQPPIWRAESLDNDTYRTLIMAKAMANITDCTPATLNKLLSYLFPGAGRCYAMDTGRMTMQYTFEFELTPTQIAILTQSGVLPRPTGVLLSIVQVPRKKYFGFSEAGGGAYLPFNQGVFFTGAINAN